jgi:hypothetical protein
MRAMLFKTANFGFENIPVVSEEMAGMFLFFNYT